MAVAMTTVSRGGVISSLSLSSLSPSLIIFLADRSSAFPLLPKEPKIMEEEGLGGNVWTGGVEQR